MPKVTAKTKNPSGLRTPRPTAFRRATIRAISAIWTKQQAEALTIVFRFAMIWAPISTRRLMLALSAMISAGIVKIPHLKVIASCAMRLITGSGALKMVSPTSIRLMVAT